MENKNSKFHTGGIFAFWKPKGISSNKFLEELRRRSGIKKIGHAGTLDPLAEGILVVGIGREATKRLGEAVAKEKEYIATIRLGITTPTDDAEGLYAAGARKVLRRSGRVNKEDIEAVLRKFKGVIDQIPPQYSAVKVKGREAYKYARKGEAVQLKPHKVEIKEIEILDYQWPFLKLRVVTGPGVYIRSLARDIGKELGVGGYLSKLTRTRVGEFTKETITPF